jgi:hypothetical protein
MNWLIWGFRSQAGSDCLPHGMNPRLPHNLTKQAFLLTADTALGRANRGTFGEPFATAAQNGAALNTTLTAICKMVRIPATVSGMPIANEHIS